MHFTKDPDFNNTDRHLILAFRAVGKGKDGLNRMHARLESRVNAAREKLEELESALSAVELIQKSLAEKLRP